MQPPLATRPGDWPPRRSSMGGNIDGRDWLVNMLDVVEHETRRLEQLHEPVFDEVCERRRGSAPRSSPCWPVPMPSRTPGPSRPYRITRVRRGTPTTGSRRRPDSWSSRRMDAWVSSRSCASYRARTGRTRSLSAAAAWGAAASSSMLPTSSTFARGRSGSVSAGIATRARTRGSDSGPARCRDGTRG